jgi:DNA-binding IscR family transcriptional regulator
LTGRGSAVNWSVAVSYRVVKGREVHCPLADSCDLSGALHEALRAFFDVLDGYTIADLADKRTSLRQRLGLAEPQIAATH